MHPLPLLITRLLMAWLLARVGTAPRHDDRGDVPGWVMITVMTAGLVAAITIIAQDQLGQILRNALNSVQ